MRYRDIINERASSSYYVHATNSENIPSILKKGLIPNASNDGLGNFDDARWVSLDGVFATNHAGQIEGYINAQNIEDNYALVVLAVSPASAIPDEDLIEILLKHAFIAFMAQNGMKAEEYLNEITQYIMDEDIDGSDLDDLYLGVALQFHAIAAKNNPHVKFNETVIVELVEMWVGFDMGEIIDPEKWVEVKDLVTRRYRDMTHPTLGSKYSIRLNQNVTFGGRNRIVAIVNCVDGEKTVVYGAVPNEARNLVNTIRP